MPWHSAPSLRCTTSSSSRAAALLTASRHGGPRQRRGMDDRPLCRRILGRRRCWTGLHALPLSPPHEQTERSGLAAPLETDGSAAGAVAACKSEQLDPLLELLQLASRNSWIRCWRCPSLPFAAVRHLRGQSFGRRVR